jgi:hypothetical protein
MTFVVLIKRVLWRSEMEGEKKSVMQSFVSQAEAEQLRDRVSEQLKIDGTTENLLLLEPHPVVSTAMH